LVFARREIFPCLHFGRPLCAESAQVQRKHLGWDAVHREMNPSPYPLTPRLALKKMFAVQFGVVALTAAIAGCARRPIIVQAPPATVIQNPAPTTTTVNTLPPAGRDVIVVKEAPPPPREEAPPPPPSNGYSWVPGYWTSRDGRQEWVAGRWEMPPRANATWVAPRWERRGEGYVFIEGYWR